MIYPLNNPKVTCEYGKKGSWACGWHSGVDFISSANDDKILSVLAKDGLRAAEGVDVQPIPMQRLFVQLINHKNHDALRKGGVLK